MAVIVVVLLISKWPIEIILARKREANHCDNVNVWEVNIEMLETIKPSVVTS
jgi:hypothetical protein